MRPSNSEGWSNNLLGSAALCGLVMLLLFAVAGCETAQFGDFTPQQLAAQAATNAFSADSIVLHEGDVVKVIFPGAPNLNASQPIRRDGRITLQLLGEVQASGKTPSDLEKELIKLYGPQLVNKEVSVTLESSAFAVYVTGAVLRPGKVISDRPLTALEAIMEAGGFDYTKANLKKITVIRHENSRTDHFKLNLKGLLQGEESEQFDLKPADIVYVPERFSWF